VNRSYYTARTITSLVALFAITVSFTHIVALFQSWGLTGWQSYIAPIFVDGMAFQGWLCRRPSLPAETRRMGLWVQIGATIISLVANILAGDSRGGMILGGLVVGGYVVAEMMAERLHAAKVKADAEARAAELAAAAEVAEHAKRSAAAQAAAATRRAKAEAAAAVKAEHAAKAPRAPRKPRAAKAAPAPAAEVIPAGRYI
jgi:Protein of unknown function (DUF2637)